MEASIDERRYLPWSLGFMGFPEKKARSMDPMTVTKKRRLPVDVRAWALFTAGVTAFSFAVGYLIAHAHALDHFHVPCWQFSFLPCDHLTDAEEAVVNAMWLGVLSCVALQTPMAVLALRLRCRRRWIRRALTCLMLALTIVAHSLYATAACLYLVARQGDLFKKIFWIVSILAYAAISVLVLLDEEE